MKLVVVAEVKFVARLSRELDYTFAMSKPVAIPPPGFESLSVDQQIDYIQSLWDRIAEAQRKIASPEWHRDVVRDRIAEHRNDPDPGRPWNEVNADLLA